MNSFQKVGASLLIYVFFVFLIYSTGFDMISFPGLVVAVVISTGVTLFMWFDDEMMEW